MTSAPFTFDLIDSAGYGYQRVWRERHYLAKLALIPLLMKFALGLMSYALGYDDQFLRDGLIMLPAIFAEGWVMAQFLRTLLLEERWPRPIPLERDEAAFNRVILRARGIVSATLVYVLIHIINKICVWFALSVDARAQEMVAQREAGTDTPEAGSGLFMIPAIGFLFLVIWAFRLAWLYIPYSVLMPMRDYLERLGGFMASVRMLGLFLICVIPLGVLASVLAGLLASPYGDNPDAMPSFIYFVITLIGSFAELITSLIVTAGMAYALRNIIPHSPAALRDVSEGN